MEIDKLQKFLKTKHKFDKKLSIDERWETLDEYFSRIKNLDKNNADVEEIKEQTASFLVEFIKFLNEKDIELIDIFKNTLGFGL